MIRILTVGGAHPELAALLAAHPAGEVVIIGDQRPPPIERMKIEMAMKAPEPISLPPPPREWWRGKRPR